MDFHSVNIVGRYKAPDDVNLSGDHLSLSKLARLLSSVNTELKLHLYVPTSETASPYLAFLKLIKVSPGDGNACISLCEDMLVISGSSEKIRQIGESIEGLLDDNEPSTEVTRHIHIEYYPEHFFLTPDSIPIVVALEQ